MIRHVRILDRQTHEGSRRGVKLSTVSEVLSLETLTTLRRFDEIPLATSLGEKVGNSRTTGEPLANLALSSGSYSYLCVSTT